MPDLISESLPSAPSAASAAAAKEEEIGHLLLGLCQQRDERLCQLIDESSLFDSTVRSAPSRAISCNAWSMELWTSDAVTLEVAGVTVRQIVFK